MITIRPATPDDAAVILGMLDRAVEWLVAGGRTGQWGTEPFSADPHRRTQADGWIAGGGVHIAEIDAAPVGALAVGSAPAYATPVDEPELYINLLVTERAWQGSGVGARLLDHARDIARDRGVTLVRVDCYAGDDRKLVRYYERQGFTATDPFGVELPDGTWPGQTLEQRLS